ncbi:MAG: ATPase, T2SS/T4P/T4SS family [Paracoccaceae bacterium]|nr:ATPase, T2SS/T4P/T4SS family [Paracoccaceae bacterium]
MATTVSPAAVHPAMLGPVAVYLEDPDVIEISLNPDGNLFVERFGFKPVKARKWDANSAESLIRWCASTGNRIIDKTSPIVSVMIPGQAHRIEALLPPVVGAPVFSIRRHTEAPVGLNDFDWEIGGPRGSNGSGSGIAVVERALGRRRNVVIAGSTGSGKTAFANACLGVLARACPAERLVVIEDTPELRPALSNTVPLRTTETVDLHRLLVSALRLAPDRIVVGECRDGAAALTLLRAWNTGHRGGITTLHANGAGEVVARLDMLCSEVAVTSQERLIRATVDIVIYLERGAGRPSVREILEIKP